MSQRPSGRASACFYFIELVKLIRFIFNTPT